MRKPSLFYGAGLGAWTSLPAIALSYLAEQLAGLPFLPFVLFEWLTRVLPGGLVTFGIDTMVGIIRTLNLGETSSAGKVLEQLLGITMLVGIFALAGLAIAWILRSTGLEAVQAGGIVGAVLFLFFVAIELSMGGLSDSPQWTLLWFALLLPGWAVFLALVLDSRYLAPVHEVGAHTDRRRFLIRLAGGSLAVLVAALGLGRLLETRREATGAAQSIAGLSTPDVPTPQPTGEVSTGAALDPVPGTRPVVTPNSEFYRIDINLRPPVVAQAEWTLGVMGLFDRPRPLTLDDLMAFPAATQPITLSCISNPVGGDLIGTSHWTGVRLMDLLDDLGLRAEAQELYITAADGFYESVQMADLTDPRVLLVYGMNGETLPVEHGFPLRIYIPNRYGMKQPKWITSIEAIDSRGPGYWVDRGWDAEARPKIVSVIDAVAVDGIQAGRVPVGGIAWAGDRGIQKVEVQVDDGDWDEATLLLPTLGPLTWVQWRYDWPVAPGEHVFRVRATDGTGMLQIEEESPPHPSGATGYHAYQARL